MSCAVGGSRGGVDRGYEAEGHALAGLEGLAEHVVVGGDQHARCRPTARGRRRRAAGRAGVPGAHECDPRLGARLGGRREQPLQVLGELGPVHRAVPAEPRGGGYLRAQHRPEGGLVHLEQERTGARHPATYVGQVVADPLGERLRQLTAVAVVGQHLVAARPLDRRRQRPGAGDLHLEVPGVALERLLQHVEVLAELAAGPPLVQARAAAGQPPARGLEVGAELGDDGQRPARHRARWRRVRGARAGAAGRAARRRRCARPRPGRSRGRSRHRSRGSRRGLDELDRR